MIRLGCFVIVIFGILFLTGTIVCGDDTTNNRKDTVTIKRLETTISEQAKDIKNLKERCENLRRIVFVEDLEKEKAYKDTIEKLHRRIVELENGWKRDDLLPVHQNP